MNRRHFIKVSGITLGAGLIPLCQLSIAEPAAKVSPEDPQAKALGYVDVSTVVGSNCANCMQAKGAAGAEWLGCNLFAGKEVKASGWCKVWMVRPA